MRFFLDQDVYAATDRFLRGFGHDVVTASEMGLGRAPDPEILRASRREGRILITRDRGFGNLVLIQNLGTGVLCLRMAPATMADVHTELARILDSSTEEELHQAYVIVEPGRHRLRKTRPETAAVKGQ